MTENDRISFLYQLGRWVVILLGSPWFERAVDVWKLARKTFRGLAEEGIYEVLTYESTLELLDKKGERARVRKHEKVRYLQNSIMAYQDQAWGDGEILVNYRCTPGTPVDRYRPGKKTYILISLREVRNRGDEDEFHMGWEINGGFVRDTEQWEAHIGHHMQKLRLQVIFPTSRPPVRVSLFEEMIQRTRPLGQHFQKRLPDGRWLAFWETSKPRRYETYGLTWEW